METHPSDPCSAAGGRRLNVSIFSRFRSMAPAGREAGGGRGVFPRRLGAGEGRGAGIGPLFARPSALLAQSNAFIALDHQSFQDILRQITFWTRMQQ